MLNSDSLLAVLGASGGIGLTGYVLFRSVYRRVVRDGVEVTKDRNEGDFVGQLMTQNKTLTEENNQLRLSFERLTVERAETLSKLGRLEADKEHAAARLAEAQLEIAMLRRQLGIALTTDGKNAN